MARKPADDKLVSGSVLKGDIGAYTKIGSGTEVACEWPDGWVEIGTGCDLGDDCTIGVHDRQIMPPGTSIVGGFSGDRRSFLAGLASFLVAALPVVGQRVVLGRSEVGSRFDPKAITQSGISGST